MNSLRDDVTDKLDSKDWWNARDRLYKKWKSQVAVKNSPAALGGLDHCTREGYKSRANVTWRSLLPLKPFPTNLGH